MTHPDEPYLVVPEPILALTKENIADIEKVYQEYEVIPVRFITALIAEAKENVLRKAKKVKRQPC